MPVQENTQPQAETKQTNKERLKEITDSIEKGIKELFESDKYKQYLTTMSRFHRYSVNNQMLIYMQMPNATHVAGFNKWHDQFGRNVMKGQRGIKIIAPTPFKKKIEKEKLDPDTKLPMLDADGKPITEEKEISVPMFKPVTVFDVSQTEGKPLPQLASDLHGNVQNFDVFMEALKRSAPVPITIEPMAANMDGFYNTESKDIHIREGMSEVQTVSAAVHEIAHSKLHDYKKNELLESKADYQEIEVCGVNGLFSNGRIDRSKLPEGLYCYDLRGTDDDPGELHYLEEQVVVNHAGSVITAEPIDLTEAGRLDVYEDMGFQGGSMTLRQFYENAYPEKAKKSRNTEEVEAESISFAVCAYYGIATGENSFGYIATWSKDKELKELRSSLETINKTSSELITDIDRNFAEITKERGITQTANEIENEPALSHERLYAVDDKYLHVQRCDTGFDYTLYDKNSKQEIDGGQLDSDLPLIMDAAMEICKLHELGSSAPLQLADIGILDDLQNAEVRAWENDRVQAVETTVKESETPTVPTETRPETPEINMDEPIKGGGFPDETGRLAEQLALPRVQEILASEVNALYIQYFDQPYLLRFKYHNLENILTDLKELGLPRNAYSAFKTEPPELQGFITEDEIAESLSHGSGMEGGKLRIYEFFTANHTTKELADFLKEEYGTGGHSHAVSGATHSGEDHSAKGISLKKGNCAEIQLKWGDVAKRITDLIRKDRYLTPLEQEKYKAIHDAPTAYNSVKEQHPDDLVLYQVGDFFELYGEDAKIAAEELDLYLTSRRIPDVGRVDMCGIPARKLEEYVEKLRDKHDVTISAVNEDTHERHAYTMLSIDHEAERATDAYEAEHGADGYLAFPGNRPEEEPKRELTQDDIDESLLRWNGDPDSQSRMFSYMREHGRKRGAAAWLSQEYGGNVNEPLHISLAGTDSEVTLKWVQVQRRLLQLMNDGRFPEQQKNIAEYLGERGNTLYFYAPVSFGSETDFGDVPKLRDDQRVVIASPVCYHGDEFLQEHRVTFLKIGRDIEEAQLKGQNPTEQIAAMEQASNAFYTPEDRAYHVGDHVSIGNEADGKSEIVIENVDADYVYYTFPDMEQEPVEILRSQFDAHLDDGLFAVIQPEEPAADLSPERMEQLVEAFEAAGYTYDDINSYGGYLVFHGEGGDGCAFQSWEEADEWINGVIFDEPERNEAVERVLHPERYEREEPTAEATVQETELPFPYEVGDTVYLEDGKPFLIENIGMFDIQLRDPSLAYPILRAESRENFARLMERFPQPKPNYTIETVAEYPAEENHLPYDVVIQTIKTTEPDPPAQNFKITDDHLGEGGPKAKFRMNMDAINLLKELEFDGRQATPEEQEVLSKYVGWGGLADAFDESKENWSSEFQELYAALSPEEYAAARASTLNAHYTSPTVIRAIYEAVENMGFQSGNILEPAMGVGNFFGLLPDELSGSKLYGVELDSITGRIAKQLYPNADITVAGFETTDRRDFYDLAIGNVPFGQYQVDDKPYNKLGFSIHNYFFAKSLDQVRPGGVVAFVTSRYTMDAKDSSARKYLAERADFLGAIRLPNNAFRANAGTDVVSDIIFLQKRDHPITIDEDWIHLGENDDGFAINSYFVEHPEMILGRQTSESTQYGKQDFTVEPIEGLELKDQLSDAIKYIRGTYQEAELPELGEGEEIDTSIPADPNVRNYSYNVVDGEVYYRENSRMVKPELNATAQERVKGMVALRDCVQKLIGQQMDGFISDETIRETQAELNGLYDSFTEKYGLINSRANSLAFADDSSYYLLCSLEVLDEDNNLQRKADMFTKRTIKPHEAVTSVDTASEALALSISEKACVDMEYMSSLTGKSEEELADELRGVIYLDFNRTPDGAYTYRTADDFLSGNVREKLAYYENALKLLPESANHYEEIAANVESLRAAQPKDLDASEIEVRLGATWIDKEYIRQFMLETFEPPYYMRRAIDVNYSEYTAEWSITNKANAGRSNIAAFMTYGTDRANAYKILEDTLNLRDVRIYDTKTDADGKERRVLNNKETTLAQQKQQAIKDAFRDWIWKDPDRRQTLVARYNELFNSTRPREYDGSHITFSGMNPEIQLREHQLNAVAHILYGGNTLLAHEVGAGKSATRS